MSARQSPSLSPSSSRTPATRVQSRTMAPSASSVIVRVPSRLPCAASSSGIRCYRAMCVLSSGVYPEISMISQRSSSGPGMVSSWFAVAMNITRDRSNGTFR